MSAIDIPGESLHLDYSEAPLLDLPDEDLDTTRNDQAWLVKLPNFLADKWESVDAENQEIGRLRIYEAGPDGKQRITVVLPNHLATPADADPSEHVPNEYDMTILNQHSQNIFAFVEKNPEVVDSDEEFLEDRPARKRPRLREPALLAAVVHECNITPDIEAPAYRNIMRDRQKKAAQPSKQTRMLAGTQSSQNMLISGANSIYTNTKLSSFVKLKNKEKGVKLVRLPANEARDLLFAAFEEYDYWSLKSLKDRLEQPEAYIRELLLDMAQQNKRGPYAGLYSLLPEWKATARAQGGASGQGTPAAEGTATEGEGDEEMEG